MTRATPEQPRKGISWQEMESVRKTDLRSDYRDLTPGRRIEQGIELSKFATALAGKASDGGAAGPA